MPGPLGNIFLNHSEMQMMNCDFGQIPLPGASIHNVRLFTHTLEGKYWGQHCGNLKWIQETATGFLKPSLSLSLYRSSGVHGLQNSKGCPAELWVNIPGQPCYRTPGREAAGHKAEATSVYSTACAWKPEATGILRWWLQFSPACHS